MSYLFMAVPAFCGSTVLHHYLARSNSIVALEPYADLSPSVTEGLVIYDDLNSQSNKRNLEEKVPFLAYAKPVARDWLDVKTVWDQKWTEMQKSTARIFLQKTPANIYQIRDIQPVFEDLKWILMVRDPYVYVETILERLLALRFDPKIYIDKILELVVNTLRIQLDNKELLGSLAYSMTYEDFVTKSDVHSKGIQNFLQVPDISFSGKIVVKFKIYDGLESNNDERIAKLRAIPGAIAKCNEYFSQHEDALNAWGYKLISP